MNKVVIRNQNMTCNRVLLPKRIWVTVHWLAHLCKYRADFLAELAAVNVFLRIYFQSLVFAYICGRHLLIVEADREVVRHCIVCWGQRLHDFLRTGLCQ